jgi:hypothetical protein
MADTREKGFALNFWLNAGSNMLQFASETLGRNHRQAPTEL